MNKNFLLIGTTHLDNPTSIVRKIEEFKPDIIGVELCNTRLNLMVINPITNQLSENQLEKQGIIEKISNSIQKKALEENRQYGSDMITASKYAIEKKIKLVCLDKDILEIKRLMELLPVNEQQGFLTELAKFESMSLEDLKLNQLKPDEVINEMKTKYPVSYEFLIEQRDLYLAFNILKLIHNNQDKKILVFIGKGHLEKINNLLNSKK